MMNDWPGNVRELRNTLERAVMLSDSDRIDARVLGRALALLPAPARAGVWRCNREGR
jgi:DNA-binding NtrC family response regulator